MTIAKSVSKRIRITKNGKAVRRPMAVDHFRTRKNGTQVQSRRKTRSIDYPLRKLLNY